MKPRFYLLVVFIALGIYLGQPLLQAQQPATPSPTLTPSRNTLLVEDAFVRGGPNESYIPVGRIVPGMALSPLNISADGNWVLIRYNNGYGWIRRDLVFWASNINTLPVLDPNITPTPDRITNTPFFPTGTPNQDYIAVNAVSALVRGGPGRTYLRLGQLYPGDTLEPVGRNSDTSWILIRFENSESGFGWLRRDLGVWFSDLETLPVLSENRLTPTLTFTPSITATPSNTATHTFTPTPTPTATDTPTQTATPTHTSTSSNTPTTTPSQTSTHTATPEPTATDTPTDEPTATPSQTSTHTATSEPTATDTPTDEPTATPSLTSTHTATPEPTATDTATPSQTSTHTATPEPTTTDAPTDEPTATPSHTSTHTATPEPSATDAPTDEPTATQTLTSQPTVIADALNPATDIPTSTHTSQPSATAIPPTPTDEPSATPEPSATHTSTSEPTATLEATATHTQAASVTPSPTEDTSTQIAAVITVTPIPPSPTPESQPSQPESGGLMGEAIAAGVIFLGIVAYILAYLRGAAGAKRYAAGFIIETCPICREGQLSVESRTERSLGIPNTRHLVKCDHCRSLLREIGGGRWRYAVDRTANPVLYDRLNNREVREDTIQRLLEAPPDTPSPRISPGFVDDENE